jgi:hypothetical protein
MVEVLSAASYSVLSFFRFHCNRCIVFCNVVGVVSRVKIASSDSGYWSSAKRIESFDCLSCGSELMDCNNDRICFALSTADILA